jgi:hypothetical protein
MKFRHLLATFALLGASAFGMANKPKVTVRFYVETNALDGEATSNPVHLRFANKDIHVGKMPPFSELNFRSVLPYRTSDGTWGCVIQLDTQGTMRLDTLSNEARNASMVVFVSTKQGVHQVVDMIIDRNVKDGVLTIPCGLTDGEIAVFRQQFKVIDVEKDKVVENKKAAAQKKGSPREWAQDPPASGILPTPVGTTPNAAAPGKKTARKAGEPDLPRLAD